MAEVPDGARNDVVVPVLVGLEVGEARRRGTDAGLIVVGPSLDGPPLGALTWPGRFVVTGQRPAAGSHLRRGDLVVVEFRRRGGGDGAGDPEPRRPGPTLGLLAEGLLPPFVPDWPDELLVRAPGAPGGTGRSPGREAWPGRAGPGGHAPKRRSRRA